jgi:hypothetical protein
MRNQREENRENHGGKKNIKNPTKTKNNAEAG